MILSYITSLLLTPVAFLSQLEHLKGRLGDAQKDKEELAAYKMVELALNDALREKGKECERLVGERDQLKRALRRRQPPPHQPPQVRECEERSDELRRRVYLMATYNGDSLPSSLTPF